MNNNTIWFRRFKKSLRPYVLWTKVASALEGLIILSIEIYGYHHFFCNLRQTNKSFHHDISQEYFGHFNVLIQFMNQKKIMKELAKQCCTFSNYTNIFTMVAHCRNRRLTFSAISGIKTKLDRCRCESHVVTFSEVSNFHIHKESFDHFFSNLLIIFKCIESDQRIQPCTFYSIKNKSQ